MTEIAVPSIDEMVLSEAEGGQDHRHGVKRGLSPVDVGVRYLF